MELTDAGPVVLLALLALVVFGLVVAGWPRWGSRVGRAVVRGVQVVLLNVLVLALAGAALNDQYLFYSSWGDLFGSRSTSVQVHHGGTSPEVVAAPVPGPGLPRRDDTGRAAAAPPAGLAAADVHGRRLAVERRGPGLRAPAGRLRPTVLPHVPRHPRACTASRADPGASSSSTSSAPSTP